MQDQQLYQIALTMINGIGDILGRQLLQEFGDAESIFKAKLPQLERIPGIGRILISEIKRAEVLLKAEKELSFIEKNKIACYFITGKNYPFRLRECPDAPLLLYAKGNLNLQASRIVSIVGTRNMTDYGKELTENFISGLAKAFPDILVISGLAYGVDIYAHRCALRYKLPTVAVLAHGLDRIYPQLHHKTAIDMLETGGIVSDFPSGTNPDKPNFVKRNRIIAGLSDATIVIESADRGGSLITADIAVSYSRDVYAFPGRITDVRSQGCNRLIRQTKAGLISTAADFISAMCWDVPVASAQPVQKELAFVPDGKGGAVLNIIRERKEIHINELSAEFDTPVHELSEILFDLEMQGFIMARPGSTYKPA
ncbi:DNA processing protein DprA [Bacteroidia bacterium]|nr:DNA processing protein DprA [Bacteroidia bacterium]